MNSDVISSRLNDKIEEARAEYDASRNLPMGEQYYLFGYWQALMGNKIPDAKISSIYKEYYIQGYEDGQGDRLILEGRSV